MKTTILGGVLFIVPLAVVLILLEKLFHFSMIVARPLEKLLPFGHVGGIAAANLLAIFLIVLVCYLAGLFAKAAFIRHHVDRLDNILINLVPGYAATRGVIGGIAEGDGDSLVRPVLVKFDDQDAIAFEVERDDTRVSVFLPGSPSPWTGSTAIVGVDRVTPLNLQPHQAVALLRTMGRGSLAATQPTTET